MDCARELPKQLASGPWLQTWVTFGRSEFELTRLQLWGVSIRLGIGKARHLDTSLLWIRAKIGRGDVLLDKIAGVDNPADALTKCLA